MGGFVGGSAPTKVRLHSRGWPRFHVQRQWRCRYPTISSFDLLLARSSGWGRRRVRAGRGLRHGCPSSPYRRGGSPHRAFVEAWPRSSLVVAVWLRVGAASGPMRVSRPAGGQWLADYPRCWGAAPSGAPHAPRCERPAPPREDFFPGGGGRRGGIRHRACMCLPTVDGDYVCSICVGA